MKQRSQILLFNEKYKCCNQIRTQILLKTLTNRKPFQHLQTFPYLTVSREWTEVNFNTHPTFVDPDVPNFGMYLTFHMAILNCTAVLTARNGTEVFH